MGDSVFALPFQRRAHCWDSHRQRCAVLQDVIWRCSGAVFGLAQGPGPLCSSFSGIMDLPTLHSSSTL